MDLAVPPCFPRDGRLRPFSKDNNQVTLRTPAHAGTILCKGVSCYVQSSSYQVRCQIKGISVDQCSNQNICGSFADGSYKGRGLVRSLDDLDLVGYEIRTC